MRRCSRASTSHRHLLSCCLLGSILVAVALNPSGLGAQAPAKPAPQKTKAEPRGSDFRMKVEVDLVVLHTTVVDRRGRLINDLVKEHFRVYEDGIPQEIAVFRQEDVPITVGLVIDNSASMQENKPKMTAAALTFVETSNPLDEVFVVNFNEDYYLDLQRDFSSDIAELKEALEKTDARGITALWEALWASLDHIKRGTRQKKVLLNITDGVDNASRTRYEDLLKYAQQSETAIYIVALKYVEGGRDWKRARRQLRKLADATGGVVNFPESIEQVEAICKKIAHDIRNQYILAYYPSNRLQDGSFRSVRVEVNGPKDYGQLTARTRTGYYAPKSEGSGSNQ